VAARYPSFPILLEASRECLQDVFDVPALREVLGDIRSRKIRVVSVDTPKASPFAQSLLFNWIAAYMYAGDAPLAERRAAALALDRDLLRELLGAEELRDLIDADVLADLELELQRLVDTRRARSSDELHDTLRVLGDLSLDELDMRSHSAAASWVRALVGEKRAVEIRMPSDGSVRYIAAEDAARYRDALGVALPVGLPRAFTDPVDRPLESLVARYARTHGPFVTSAVARRFGVSDETVVLVLQALERADRVVRGEFRPEGREREWCDNDVLRQLRRRSLASLRREVEPVEPAAFARFLIAWHGVGSGSGSGSATARRGLDALVESLGLLQGAALPVAALESAVLPARVTGYRPADLDALCTAGELMWIGAGKDKVRLYFRDQVALLADPLVVDAAGALVGLADSPIHSALLLLLQAAGACFWPQLRAVAPAATEAEVLTALWDLVWAGVVTNDSFGALRAVARGDKPSAVRSGSSGRRPRVGRLTRLGPPQASGRWSLVAPILLPACSPTERAHARATQLLERHGVVTREAVTAEGIEGGFTSVYGVLKMLEERGVARRGYFIAGLGAAQFALPGAVDRLRSTREAVEGAVPVVLAAADPAQPYGAALPWPTTAGRPARVASAVVVLVDGEARVWFDASARHLVLFSGHDLDTSWAEALVGLVKDGRYGTIEVRKVDGATFVDQPVGVVLRAAGFLDGYKGLVYRSR
jgi:ATP-dependent helicase Lhr and Lhr-like helicase